MKQSRKTLLDYAKKMNLSIDYIEERPWGAFFVIGTDSLSYFVHRFFQEENIVINAESEYHPKFLVIKPGARLSWQYHIRRSEIWKIVSGPVEIHISRNNTEGKALTLSTGDTIHVKEKERHRIVGLESWGIIAEIWKHTHPENPSDEEDIIRLDDDFGRTSQKYS